MRGENERVAEYRWHMNVGHAGTANCLHSTPRVLLLRTGLTRCATLCCLHLVLLQDITAGPGMLDPPHLTLRGSVRLDDSGQQTAGSTPTPVRYYAPPFSHALFADDITRSVKHARTFS
jgi:hypothetical protein